MKFELRTAFWWWLLFLLPFAGCRAVENSGTEAELKLPTDVVLVAVTSKWTSAPPEVELDEWTAGARSLMLASDGTLAIVDGTVRKSRDAFFLSPGDGETVYLGRWERDRDEVLVRYVKVSETISDSNASNAPFSKVFESAFYYKTKPPMFEGLALRPVRISGTDYKTAYISRLFLRYGHRVDEVLANR